MSDSTGIKPVRGALTKGSSVQENSIAALYTLDRISGLPMRILREDVVLRSDTVGLQFFCIFQIHWSYCRAQFVTYCM